MSSPNNEVDPASLKCFAIFDSKAKAYLQPFFAPTVAVAVRTVQSLTWQDGHNFNLHAEDYCLFQIGNFNQFEGVLEGQAADAITQLVILRKTED